MTDIEDHNMHGSDDEEEDEEEHQDEQESLISTPADLVDGLVPNTPPHAPKFAPASPPITGRTTRSGQKAAEELTPIKASARTTVTTSTSTKKRSPFDGWRQTKSSAAVTGHKRPADELGSAVPAVGAKRSRS